MAFSGRSFTISKAATVLAGLRANSVSFDGSPVDITSKDDNGFITMASFAGAKSFSISGEGVVQSTDVLQDIIADEDSTLLLTDITIEWPDGASTSGDVYFSTGEFAGPHDTEMTYSITLASSGEWSYTPAV